MIYYNITFIPNSNPRGSENLLGLGYATTPVLCETFVEVPRHNGGVYRASGWIRVGTTLGRGRYGRYNKADKPMKDIWLCPLRRDWKRTLNR